MLILKTNADLPISARNVGHNIGEALKRLEMTFFTEMHLNEDATSKFESHVYEMTSIGKNVLDLGDEETFDLSKLYARLDYLQQNYSEHAVGILTDLNKSSQELEPIAAMLINEINRSFTDEIQMSTVNRLDELQNLLDTTAISTISGLLRLDWSAVSFIKQFEPLYERKHSEIIESVRNSIVEKLQSGEEIEFEDEFAKLTKDSESKVLEFTQSDVSEHVAESMRNKYTELFIANEDLNLLKDKAIDVAANCMTRGNAKKMIISNLAKDLEILHENLKPIVESFLVKKVDLSKVEEILNGFLNEFVNKSAKTVEVLEDGEFVRCLAVLHSYESAGYFVTFGETNVEFEILAKENHVKVMREEFEILEIIDEESQNAVEGQDLIEMSERLEEKFREHVAFAKADLENLISKK